MFKQGNIDSTNSVLDLAINGNGFFVQQQATTGRSATPAPATSIPTSRISSSTTTATACRGYAVGPNGQLQNGVVTDLRSSAPIGRRRPPSIQQSYSLNSTLKPPTVTPFDPSADAATYNSSSSLGIYDSQGNSHHEPVLHQERAGSECDPADSGEQLDHESADRRVNPLDPSNKTPMSFNVTFDASGQMTSVRAPDGSTSGPGFSIDATTNAFSPATGNPPTPGTGWIPAASDGARPRRPTPGMARPVPPAASPSTCARPPVLHRVRPEQPDPGRLHHRSAGRPGNRRHRVIFARYTNSQSRCKARWCWPTPTSRA